MKATIITIGDEILIGQITDTNSVSIARHLNAAGIVVLAKNSVGDDAARITEAVERALRDSEVVVLTGGLGPTKDDITKKTLAALFGCGMVRDEAVAAHVERMLAARGIEYNELNRAQALVPAACTVLFNAHGTAPGMWFERDGRAVISLPGVPFEMEHLMQDEVMPRLRRRFSLRQIVHRTLVTSGLAESMLAERIAAWEEALPSYLRLAYLPNPGAVRLRLSAYEVEGGAAEREIERQFEALRRLIPRYVVGYETASVQELVHRMLTERGATLATAERRGRTPRHDRRAAAVRHRPRPDHRPCGRVRPRAAARRPLPRTIPRTIAPPVRRSARPSLRAAGARIRPRGRSAATRTMQIIAPTDCGFGIYMYICTPLTGLKHNTYESLRNHRQGSRSGQQRVPLAPQDQAQIRSEFENQAFLVRGREPLDYPEGNRSRHENHQQEGTRSRAPRSGRPQEGLLKTAKKWQRKATECR